MLGWGYVAVWPFCTGVEQSLYAGVLPVPNVLVYVGVR